MPRTLHSLLFVPVVVLLPLCTTSPARADCAAFYLMDVQPSGEACLTMKQVEYHSERLALTNGCAGVANLTFEVEATTCPSCPPPEALTLAPGETRERYLIQGTTKVKATIATSPATTSSATVILKPDPNPPECNDTVTDCAVHGRSRSAPLFGLVVPLGALGALLMRRRRQP